MVSARSLALGVLAGALLAIGLVGFASQSNTTEVELCGPGGCQGNDNTPYGLKVPVIQQTAPCMGACPGPNGPQANSKVKHMVRKVKNTNKRLRKQIKRADREQARRISRAKRYFSDSLKRVRSKLVHRLRHLKARLHKRYEKIKRKLTPRGPRGSRGPRGPRGPKGSMGLAGPRGRRGRPGHNGHNGPRGLRGYRGPRGHQGPRGKPGRRGRTGPTGKRGDRGPRGKRGPRGPRGPAGRFVLHRPHTTHITRYTGADGRDNGYISHRVMDFTKLDPTTDVRLMYYDNLRVYQNRRHGAACRWEIRVDGRSCPSGRIGADLYIWAAANIHRPREVMGYCKGLHKGRHRVQIYVSSTPGYRSDCYTGWNAHQTSWTIEATEIPKRHKAIGYFYKTSYAGPDGRDRGFVNSRNLRFYKSRSNTPVRLTYQDNLRTHAHGGGHSCRWSLYVDGRPCPSGNIAGDLYIWGAMNLHRARYITGYCKGIKKGHHNLQIYVSPTPGYGRCDCYTGWYTNQMSWTMEAVEIKPSAKRIHHHKEGHGPADGRDHGYINGRTLNFRKRGNGPIRLLYMDNMRVYSPRPGGRACRWEIRVDGRRCPSGMIAGDAYMYWPKNSHRARTIVGYCHGLKAGNHRIQAFVSHPPHYSGDCYTGWHSGTSGWLLEATEI